MLCSACGADNAAANRFCGNCASPLQHACPACGAQVAADQRFCGQCAAPLSPTDTPMPDVSPPVAERRLCSVLFADLVGFTPLSEARDPEQVRELLSHYFEVTRIVIGRYGGTVEKFIGDAVMAVWGTPIAGEGDAERAVRAALDVIDAVRSLGAELGVEALAARAGVVTGEVAVTLGASQEGMVAGDAVNTAARVQAAARPGSVFVDATTHRLAAAAVGFDDAGEHMLKGKASAERLWRATRVLASVGGAQRIDGLEAPLTGRDAELRMVKELFHASADRRTPRLVVVSGAAGVGKSRLGWEFEKYADGLAQAMWWHRGRCLSYGEGVAFWALAQAVRQRLGIAEEDGSEVAAGKLREGLAGIVIDPSERDFVLLRLGRLLGLPVTGDNDAPLAREELFAGWRVFFERLAATAPVVWVIEDAQYADSGLLDFVDHLVDWSRDLPICVFVLARSELTETRPRFGVGRNRSMLALDPLDGASMDALVEALVPGIPPAALAAIAGHAQGVPLFAVETIRSLVDRDIVQPIDGVYRLVSAVGELTVPDSLHGLLAARLDALDVSVRALVADAAVLGLSFPAEALIAISQQDESAVRAGLAELLRREVLEVSTDPLSPERGAYQFAQQLVRQVAYDTLSRRDRKARHVRVAAHLRSTFADDGEEVSDVIARHYRDAIDAVPDDPDVPDIRDQAIAMSVRAGRRADRAGSPWAAAESFAVAARLAEIAGSDKAADWWEQAAQQAFLANNPTTLDYAQRSSELHQAAGRPRAAARAQTVSGAILRQLGRMSESRDVLSTSLDVLREHPDQDTVRALAELAAVIVFAGWDDDEHVVDESLQLAQALDVGDQLMALTFVVAGLAYNVAGQVTLSAALLEHAVRLAERAGDRFGQSRALMNLSDDLASFDAQAAAAAAARAAEIARQIGAHNVLGYATGNQAQALVSLGDWDRAESMLKALIHDEGFHEHEAVQSIRALLAGLRGDLDTAQEGIAAMDARRASEDPQDIALLASADAAVAMAIGDVSTVLNRARVGLAQVEVVGLNAVSTRWVWPMAARAARELGDTETLVGLIEMLEAHPIGHLPRVLRAELQLARGHVADLAGDSALAEELRDLAIAGLRDVPSPYHLAWALLDRGDDGDLLEAAEIADRLGAVPLAAGIAAVRRERRPSDIIV